MVKKAWAIWRGGFKDGGGTISTETGALREAPYGFKARFESGKGTNPEELIAAAHAGCFSTEIANKAKVGCPVSKVLNTKITMSSRLTT